MSDERDAAGAARVGLLSPVLTLLGGPVAGGMVCDVNGVCGPADAATAQPAPTDLSSTAGEK